MSTGLTAKEKRVLNPDPYRHYRRRYSVGEAKAGAYVLLLLAAITAWIAWKGAHPDPRLYGDPSLVPTGVGGARTDVKPAAPVTATSASAASSASGTKSGRGPLPPNLTAQGWSEGPGVRFDASNLYEKIDGRAEYFLSRGFRALTAMTLAKDGAPATTVDLELYDLGTPENGFSALIGEKPDDVKLTPTESSYIARNALFMARGRFYLRAIGSDESPEVLAELAAVRKAMQEGLAGGKRALGFILFTSIGIPADRIVYTPENAFSLSFATGVHSALTGEGDTELFVLEADSPAKAAQLASEFEKGFLEYGDPVARGGVTYMKEHYLDSYARVAAIGSTVAGVRRATSLDTADAALARLKKGIENLSAAAGNPGAGPARTKGTEGAR